MGNKLTVANQSDNDIIVSTTVNHLVLDSLHTNVQVSLPSGAPSVGLGFNVNRTNDNFGSITLASGHSWTFPMITARYILTISKRNTEVLCSHLEIPWHTDITVTRDNTLSYSSSTELHGNKVERRRKTLTQLKKTTGVPRCIVKEFMSHTTDEQETVLRELSEHIIQTRRSLSEKLHQRQCELSNGDVDDSVLRSVLTAEPFYMTNEDVTKIVNKLNSNRQTRKKLAKLVMELANK